MALRQYRTGGVFHILYRDLNGKVKTLTTGETVKKKAHVVEKVFMGELKAEKQRRRHGFTVILPAVNCEEVRDETLAAIDNTQKRRRLALSNALDVYRKHYGEPPSETRKYFERFCKNIKIKYMDEISTDRAFSYLEKTYSASSGKTYNEARSSLNIVFRRLMVQAGLILSPFAGISNKPYKGLHQRALTEIEIKKLLGHSTGDLYTAILLAWWTGLRGSSVEAVTWDEIREDKENKSLYFYHLPPKSARFNRRVKIPIHPQLWEHLKTLKRDKKTIINVKRDLREFKPLCDSLNVLDTEEGIVRFGSIRKAFIRRCDAGGVRRTATRGMAGHTSDEMTDLYSEDYCGALDILTFKHI